ncbi:hypothetical protein NTD86_15445 [Pseudomonas sp. 7P_10.2_Bac1]|uniref:hypothetical protein n=1 Tax=Pseudomonas sp. 7P_10.2_Bac1 TaxID=2971614 RepID=UPI0021C8BEC8|nr:hypothetical protein [Pseudomonas sp. 7P_10.2_Bac1]MCU1728378.1 hypothetical protein [Pseudomonas sp. 7P_10.2_Bac1]
MRQTILILFVLYLPLSESATLQIENQSSFIAVIVDYPSGYPCAPDQQKVRPCLIPPLSSTAYEMPDSDALNAALRFISMPATLDVPLSELKKHAFKSTSDFTYQPIGPLKYEQVRCETPFNEGISINIILVGVMDMTCDKGTDRRLSWVYKRNDVDLKFIIKDLPAKPRLHPL